MYTCTSQWRTTRELPSCLLTSNSTLLGLVHLWGDFSLNLFESLLATMVLYYWNVSRNHYNLFAQLLSFMASRSNIAVIVALLVHQWLLFHVHIVKFQILYSVVFFPVCVQDHWGCTARSTFWIQQSSPLAFWSDRQQTQKAAGAGRFPEGQRVIIGSYYSPKWGKRGLAIKQRLMQSFVKSHNSW